jgi:chromosome segregation protein
MKLKTLEISGFKSFANRTKIDFMPGITGVVGPNGSGKSNIIEAIRWVMGETSAKGLRGDKMADVIFGGTNTRAPLNRAEVSITFDNEDHYLNTTYTEIRITRTLYRSGESKYQINGSTVRLKDIHELFMDSGLGRESFSIISQGRVESIFSAKPTERRAIIEDVAGVYKYKQNKDQAEKELAATLENLHRVQDILYDLDERIEPLSEQASRAQDYVVTKKNYDQLDQSRLVIELTDFFADQKDNLEQITQAEAKNTADSEHLAHQNQNLNTLKIKRAELEEHREQKQTKLVVLTQRFEQLNGEQNLQAERDANRTQTGRDLRARIDQIETTLANFKQNKELRSTELAEISGQLAKLEEALKKSSAQALQEALVENQTNLSEVRTNLVDAMQALTSAKNEQTYLAKEHQQNDANLERLNSKMAEFKQRSQVQDEQITEKKTAFDLLNTDLTEQKKVIAEQQVAGQQLQNQQENSRKQWFDALEKHQQAASRLQSLQRLSNNYDGYFQGVKNLMNAKEQFTGLRGVVAELIQVAPEKALAIETALGGGLQNVIVDDENAAKTAIQYLTKNRLGRVTFLPIATIKARTLQSQQIQLAQNEAGFIGIASDLVQTAPEYSTIFKNLLGTTIIVDTLEHAQKIARGLQHRVRLVTLDGQVMNAGGSMVGGANRNTGNGLLAQQTEIETLTKHSNELADTATKLEAQTRELEAQVQTAAVEYRNKQQAVLELNEQVQTAAGEVTLAENVAAQIKREFEALKYETMQSSDGTTDHATLVANNQNALKENQQAVNDLQQRLDLLTTQHAQLVEESDSAEQAVAEIRVSMAKTQAEQQNAQVRLDDLDDQITAEEQLYANLQARLLELTTDGSDGQKQIQSQLEQVEKDLTALKDELATLTPQLADITQQITVSETDVQTAQTFQTQALRAFSDLTAHQAELKQKISQNMLALEETYETTYEVARDSMEQLDLSDLKTQLKLLKLTLADIGNVNLGAIEEYKLVKERHDFLAQQQADLLEAQTNLRTTMSEMDQEVISRFKATFDEIAQHFSGIFAKMFGGGKAVLELTDPTDLLNTGVDIKAQPPGKKFQQMSLLSGGEKALTAISLLFAILEVRPVPFAVLDETEAALDEANVDRFAEYLHDVNNRTQFIVITHRKGTMKNADVLYGVTMQDPGISTMVSVNLEEMSK